MIGPTYSPAPSFIFEIVRETLDQQPRAPNSLRTHEDPHRRTYWSYSAPGPQPGSASPIPAAERPPRTADLHASDVPFGGRGPHRLGGCEEGIRRAPHDDGKMILPQFIQTHDFLHFKSSPLTVPPCRVLARPRFKFDPARVREVLTKLEAYGLAVDATQQRELDLPDPDDEPFLGVALAGPTLARQRTR
jgi:hypothetical protein